VHQVGNYFMVYTDVVKKHAASVLIFQRIESKLKFKCNVNWCIKIFCRIWIS